MTRPEDKTILVVDDEPNVREYLATVLEDAGFQVRIASDGEEALETIRQNKPDFISLDLVMPRKSGHRLLYELKRDKELARIPVLIVTAHAKDDLGQADMDEILDNRVMSGPGVYLEKPVNPRNYVRSVKRALGLEVEEDEAEQKLGLREELNESLRGASPEALRKALEALKKDGKA